MGRPSPPVRRYLLAVPVTLVVFLALAMIEERETFLPLLSPMPAITTAGDPMETAASEAVTSALESLHRAYALGDPAPLDGAPLSEELRAELTLEVRMATPCPRDSPAVRILGVRREAGRWEVTTEESWDAGGLTRYRYGLHLDGGRMVVEEMVPLVEEPRAPPR